MNVFTQEQEERIREIISETGGGEHYNPGFKIAARAANAFGLDYSDMLSARRTDRYAKARFAAMFLMREQGMSYPKIAVATGRSDHTTVIHGVNQAARLLEESPHFSEVVEGIRSGKEVQWSGVLVSPWIMENGLAVRDFYESGKTLAETAAHFEKSISHVSKAVKAMGGVIRPSSRHTHDSDRLAAIVAMRSSGSTLREIGEKFGISRQRVQQIIARNGSRKSVRGY